MVTASLTHLFQKQHLPLDVCSVPLCLGWPLETSVNSGPQAYLAVPEGVICPLNTSFFI